MTLENCADEQLARLNEELANAEDPDDGFELMYRRLINVQINRGASMVDAIARIRNRTAAHRAGELPPLRNEVIAAARERAVPGEVMRRATGQTPKQLSNLIGHATETRDARAALAVPQFEMSCAHQLIPLYSDAIHALTVIIRSRVRRGENRVPGIFHAGFDIHTISKFEDVTALIRWLIAEVECLRSSLVPHSEQRLESDQTSEMPT